MDWYYVSQGQPAGPISEENLAELLRNGTVTAATLVWRNGLTNWIPLSEAQPGWMNPPSLTPASASAPVIPPMADASGATVGAPSEPTGPSSGPANTASTPVDDFLSEEELLATDYPVDLIEPIRRGWRTFFGNPGLLLGSSIVIWLLIVAASSVPILGFFAQIALYGPLLGGLWAIFLRIQRGRPAELGLAFGAFGPRFMQFLLAYLIPMLANLALMIPVMIFAFFLAFGAASAGNAAGKAQSIDAVFAGLSVGVLVVGGCILFALGVAVWLTQLLWMFAVPLVADKGYDAIPALRLSWKRVSRHLGWHLLFGITLGLFSMLGMLALCVGLLVALPVAFSALAHWYDNLFGRLRPQGPSLTR